MSWAVLILGLLPRRWPGVGVCWSLVSVSQLAERSRRTLAARLGGSHAWRPYSESP